MLAVEVVELYLALQEVVEQVVVEQEKVVLEQLQRVQLTLVVVEVELELLQELLALVVQEL